MLPRFSPESETGTSEFKHCLHVIYNVNYLNAKIEVSFNIAQGWFAAFIISLLLMRQNICTTDPLLIFGEF